MPKKSARKALAPTLSSDATKFRPGDTLPPELVELFEKHLKYLAAGRANYGKADRILEQILQRCEPGCEHVTEAVGKTPPQRMTIVDKFADTNQVWAGSSCKRIAIEVKAIKPQDR